MPVIRVATGRRGQRYHAGPQGEESRTAPVPASHREDEDPALSSDSIKVGVVGAGGNTRKHHIPKLQAQKGVEVVTVARSDIDSRPTSNAWRSFWDVNKE